MWAIKSVMIRFVYLSSPLMEKWIFGMRTLRKWVNWKENKSTPRFVGNRQLIEFENQFPNWWNGIKFIPLILLTYIYLELGFTWNWLENTAYSGRIPYNHGSSWCTVTGKNIGRWALLYLKELEKHLNFH